VAWWLRQVESRGLLSWNDLSPPALTSIMQVMGRNDPMGLKARSLLAQHPYHAHKVWLFENLDDTVTTLCSDRNDPERAAIGQAGVCELFSQDSADFFARFYLLDEAQADGEAKRTILHVYKLWHGQSTFRAALFEQVWSRGQHHRTMSWLEANRLPTVLPDWWPTLKPAEMDFLQIAFTRGEFDRKIIFQVIYFGMMPAEIAATVLTGIAWSRELARMKLRHAWEEIWR
jgi:hypothetical protein